MPDLRGYGPALLLAVLVSLTGLLIRRRLGRMSLRTSADADLAGFLPGLAAALLTGPTCPAIPMLSALDRLIAVILPVAVLGELLRPHAPRITWGLRLVVAILCPMVLLAGSSYLQAGGWSWLILGEIVAGHAICLLFVWSMAAKPTWPGDDRPWDVALSLALASASAAILMGGYLKGGMAALQMAVSVAVISSGNRIFAGRASGPGVRGLAIVGLFGVLFTGIYFGRLAVFHGVIILAAPLALATPGLGRLPAGPVRRIAELGLVVLPLALVLAQCRAAFVKTYAQFLSQASGFIVSS